MMNRREVIKWIAATPFAGASLLQSVRAFGANGIAAACNLPHVTVSANLYPLGWGRKGGELWLVLEAAVMSQRASMHRVLGDYLGVALSPQAFQYDFNRLEPWACMDMGQQIFTMTAPLPAGLDWAVTAYDDQNKVVQLDGSGKDRLLVSRSDLLRLADAAALAKMADAHGGAPDAKDQPAPANAGMPPPQVFLHKGKAGVQSAFPAVYEAGLWDSLIKALGNDAFDSGQVLKPLPQLLADICTMPADGEHAGDLRHSAEMLDLGLMMGVRRYVDKDWFASVDGLDGRLMLPDARERHLGWGNLGGQRFETNIHSMLGQCVRIARWEDIDDLKKIQRYEIALSLPGAPAFVALDSASHIEGKKQVSAYFVSVADLKPFILVPGIVGGPATLAEEAVSCSAAKPAETPCQHNVLDAQRRAVAYSELATPPAKDTDPELVRLFRPQVDWGVRIDPASQPASPLRIVFAPTSATLGEAALAAFPKDVPFELLQVIETELRPYRRMADPGGVVKICRIVPAPGSEADFYKLGWLDAPGQNELPGAAAYERLRQGGAYQVEATTGGGTGTSPLASTPEFLGARNFPWDDPTRPTVLVSVGDAGWIGKRVTWVTAVTSSTSQAPVPILDRVHWAWDGAGAAPGMIRMRLPKNSTAPVLVPTVFPHGQYELALMTSNLQLSARVAVGTGLAGKQFYPPGEPLPAQAVIDYADGLANYMDLNVYEAVADKKDRPWRSDNRKRASRIDCGDSADAWWLNWDTRRPADSIKQENWNGDHDATLISYYQYAFREPDGPRPSAKDSFASTRVVREYLHDAYARNREGWTVWFQVEDRLGGDLALNTNTWNALNAPEACRPKPACDNGPLCDATPCSGDQVIDRLRDSQATPSHLRAPVEWPVAHPCDVTLKLPKAVAPKDPPLAFCELELPPRLPGGVGAQLKLKLRKNWLCKPSTAVDADTQRVRDAARFAAWRCVAEMAHLHELAKTPASGGAPKARLELRLLSFDHVRGRKAEAATAAAVAGSAAAAKRDTFLAAGLADEASIESAPLIARPLTKLLQDAAAWMESEDFELPAAADEVDRQFEYTFKLTPAEARKIRDAHVCAVSLVLARFSVPEDPNCWMAHEWPRASAGDDATSCTPVTGEPKKPEEVTNHCDKEKKLFLNARREIRRAPALTVATSAPAPDDGGSSRQLAAAFSASDTLRSYSPWAPPGEAAEAPGVLKPSLIPLAFQPVADVPAAPDPKAPLGTTPQSLGFATEALLSRSMMVLDDAINRAPESKVEQHFALLEAHKSEIEVMLAGVAALMAPTPDRELPMFPVVQAAERAAFGQLLDEFENGSAAPKAVSAWVLKQLRESPAFYVNNKAVLASVLGHPGGSTLPADFAKFALDSEIKITTTGANVGDTVNVAASDYVEAGGLSFGLTALADALYDNDFDARNLKARRIEAVLDPEIAADPLSKKGWVHVASAATSRGVFMPSAGQTSRIALPSRRPVAPPMLLGIIPMDPAKAAEGPRPLQRLLKDILQGGQAVSLGGLSEGRIEKAGSQASDKLVPVSDYYASAAEPAGSAGFRVDRYDQSRVVLALLIHGDEESEDDYSNAFQNDVFLVNEPQRVDVNQLPPADARKDKIEKTDAERDSLEDFLSGKATRAAAAKTLLNTLAPAFGAKGAIKSLGLEAECSTQARLCLKQAGALRTFTSQLFKLDGPTSGHDYFREAVVLATQLPAVAVDKPSRQMLLLVSVRIEGWQARAVEVRQLRNASRCSAGQQDATDLSPRFLQASPGQSSTAPLMIPRLVDLDAQPPGADNNHVVNLSAPQRVSSFRTLISTLFAGGIAHPQLRDMLALAGGTPDAFLWPCVVTVYAEAQYSHSVFTDLGSDKPTPADRLRSYSVLHGGVHKVEGGTADADMDRDWFPAPHADFALDLDWRAQNNRTPLRVQRVRIRIS